MVYGLMATVSVARATSSHVILQEDMECEMLDFSTVEEWAEIPVPYTTARLERTVSANHTSAASGTIIMEANTYIKFNCSYSPSSASMDFGVIDSTGRFYFINVKGGSICQTIQISQRNSYTVAIRNNSSQTVRVVGFVEY